MEDRFRVRSVADFVDGPLSPGGNPTGAAIERLASGIRHLFCSVQDPLVGIAFVQWYPTAVLPLRRATHVFSALLYLAACGSGAAHPRTVSHRDVPRPLVSAPSSCDTRAASDLDANGDLDGELRVLDQCKDPPPELLARRLDILVELGEVDDARSLARAVPAGAPPALRAAGERALAEPDTKPPAATLLDMARDATSRGIASRERGDAKESARLLTRAR